MDVRELQVAAKILQVIKVPELAESPDEESPGEAGSSRSRTCDTTHTAVTTVDTTGAKSVGEAQPPGIAKHSVTTAGTTVAKNVDDGEVRPVEIAKYSAAQVTDVPVPQSEEVTQQDALRIAELTVDVLQQHVVKELPRGGDTPSSRAVRKFGALLEREVVP